MLAGPAEATALGNVLVQLMAGGQLASLAEGRQLVRQSFPVEAWELQPTDEWEAAYHRYLRLKG